MKACSVVQRSVHVAPCVNRPAYGGAPGAGAAGGDGVDGGSARQQPASTSAANASFMWGGTVQRSSVAVRVPAMTREFAFPGTRARYAPDRVVDLQHLALAVTVELEQRSIQGTATLRCSVIAPNTRSVELDAVELAIDKVEV